MADLGKVYSRLSAGVCRQAMQANAWLHMVKIDRSSGSLQLASSIALLSVIAPYRAESAMMARLALEDLW